MVQYEYDNLLMTPDEVEIENSILCHLFKGRKGLKEFSLIAACSHTFKHCAVTLSSIVLEWRTNECGVYVRMNAMMRQRTAAA
jgi:hypothetical protein